MTVMKYMVMSEKTHKPTIGYFDGAKLLYTQEDVDATAERDEKQGYEDRKNHVYDKWYRYTRSDNGKAYDNGVQRFIREGKQSKRWFEEDEANFHLIEVNH